MTVLLIAGSPSEKSRSAALLDGVQQRLHARGAHVERLQIRDLSPQALILAAYSGVLKVFLDLLPQNALQGKTVLPLASLRRCRFRKCAVACKHRRRPA